MTSSSIRTAAARPWAREIPAAYSVDRLASLRAAVDDVVGVEVSELDEQGLETELSAIETARRRLDARCSRAAAELSSRRAAAARRRAEAERKDADRAARRAHRDTRDELANRLDWTPTEAADAERLGNILARGDQLAEAADRGEIPPANARHLARTLDSLDVADVAEAERRLLRPAKTQTPGVFSRTCRQVLAELDHQAAADAEARRHARRKASVTDTDDHMRRVYGEWAGIDGAIIERAIDAHRRPDAPGEHRRPQHVTADAFVAMAQAALDHLNCHRRRCRCDDSHSTAAEQSAFDRHFDGAVHTEARVAGAVTNHGAVPHVLCVIPIQTLLEGAGPVGVDGTTLPLDAIRHLLDGAGWSFLVTDRHRPIAISSQERPPTVGLWRALQWRDPVCIFEGCEIPARWCDVMHLEVPDRDDGPLSPDNAGLGCRQHHRTYDNGRLTLHRRPDGRPVLRPRDGPAP